LGNIPKSNIPFTYKHSFLYLFPFYGSKKVFTEKSGIHSEVSRLLGCYGYWYKFT